MTKDGKIKHCYHVQSPSKRLYSILRINVYAKCIAMDEANFKFYIKDILYPRISMKCDFFPGSIPLLFVKAVK